MVASASGVRVPSECVQASSYHSRVKTHQMPRMKENKRKREGTGRSTGPVVDTTGEPKEGKKKRARSHRQRRRARPRPIWHARSRDWVDGRWWCVRDDARPAG